MTNEEKLDNSSFFESVAHHNLERFHSETIAWIFNTFPDTAKNFIKSIHEVISSVNDIKLDAKCCWAESNQIDILLKYSYNSKNYQIIIENKIKASEHKIEAKKLQKGENFDDYKMQLSESEIKYLNKDVGKLKLSQTEYYYLREKMERVEQIVDFELKKDKTSFYANPNLILQKYISDNVSTIQSSISRKSFKKDCIKFLNEDKNINAEYCRYVYLKPSKINEVEFKKHNGNDFNLEVIDFKESNNWNKQLGENPWITLTYVEFIKTIKDYNAVNNKTASNEDFIIANAYIKFIEDNIKEQVNLDDFNKNDEYSRFDYFKLLFALVKSKKTSNNQIGEYINAGSSNGKMPLFAFYKKIELDKNYTFFTDSLKNNTIIKPTINIGIQVQGENFKYYVSADSDNYDKTKVNNQTEYVKFCREILIKITQKYNDKFSKGKKNNNDIESFEGFNSNTTKTFYSRSYKIKNFIASEKNKIDQSRDIFSVANEISEKVNDFVNFDITDLIKSYNK